MTGLFPHQLSQTMNHSSDDESAPPRSFRLSSGKGKNARAVLAAGVFWFLLTGFIAAPFSQLWGFYLSCVLVSAVGLLLSRSKPQVVAGVSLPMLSGVFCYLSLVSES